MACLQPRPPAFPGARDARPGNPGNLRRFRDFARATAHNPPHVRRACHTLDAACGRAADAHRPHGGRVRARRRRARPARGDDGHHPARRGQQVVARIGPGGRGAGDRRRPDRPLPAGQPDRLAPARRCGQRRLRVSRDSVLALRPGHGARIAARCTLDAAVELGGLAGALRASDRARLRLPGRPPRDAPLATGGAGGDRLVLGAPDRGALRAAELRGALCTRDESPAVAARGRQDGAHAVLARRVCEPLRRGLGRAGAIPPGDRCPAPPVALADLRRPADPADARRLSGREPASRGSEGSATAIVLIVALTSFPRRSASPSSATGSSTSS